MMLISASNAGRATDTRTSAWAARWNTTSGWRRPMSSTSAGARMSSWWNVSSCAAARRARRPGWPASRSTGRRSTSTAWPSASRRSTRCEPMKPAPPVTSALTRAPAPGRRRGRHRSGDRLAPSPTTTSVSAGAGTDHGAAPDDRPSTTGPGLHDAPRAGAPSRATVGPGLDDGTPAPTTTRSTTGPVDLGAGCRCASTRVRLAGRRAGRGWPGGTVRACRRRASSRRSRSA